MSIDTDLMWELPPGTPAWEDLTPEEQAASIEALLVADYQAEQAQLAASRTIWIGPECPSFTAPEDTDGQH